ncbi:MAG: hypothetical protein IJZ30_05025 [Alphaproteobacteria bacterium]|nr:hypothetical protein [Alphaproteobacteria bacterium]
MLTKIINIEDVSVENKNIGGGKFAGLVELRTLVDKYNKEFGLRINVPKSFCIPVKFFDEYEKSGKVSEELVNEAMCCLVGLGGNVAVRSSCDVEDKGGKTYSGEFETVLNVKNKKEMRDALEQVYASAKRIEGAKMGIIIQPMIEKPLMAGVVYSETWYSDPFVVLNYVENKLANELVSRGGSDGKLFAVGKILTDEKHDMIRLNLKTLDDLRYNMVFYRNVSVNSPEKVTDIDRNEYKRQFFMASLAMQLEQDLGYPIDMEFAISQKGEINILQQRPYILPKMFERKIDANITTYFSLDKYIIEGKVGFVKDIREFGCKKDYEVNIWKKDESVRIFTNQSIGNRIAFMGFRDSSPFAVEYNHCGNMKRENLDFREMEIFGRVKDFEHIKEGDYIKINLITGEMRHLAQKDKEIIDLFMLKKER